MDKKDFIIKDFAVEYIKKYINLLNEIILEKKWLGTNTPYTYSSSYSYLVSRIESHHPFILIFKNKDLIGWADVDRYSNKTGLLGIGIKVDYRNKGIGKYLLELIINKSKEYGYERLDLRVRVTNQRAIELYKKIGFKETEYIENGIYLDREKIDLIKMSLELNQERG